MRSEDLWVRVLGALIIAGFIAIAVAIDYWANDGDWKCMVNEKCRVVHQR